MNAQYLVTRPSHGYITHHTPHTTSEHKYRELQTNGGLQHDDAIVNMRGGGGGGYVCEEGEQRCELMMSNISNTWGNRNCADDAEKNNKLEYSCEQSAGEETCSQISIEQPRVAPSCGIDSARSPPRRLPRRLSKRSSIDRQHVKHFLERFVRALWLTVPPETLRGISFISVQSQAFFDGRRRYLNHAAPCSVKQLRGAAGFRMGGT